MISHIKKIATVLLIAFFFVGGVAVAQVINLDANKLLPHSELSFSPRTGSFEEGSTFQVPILLNTKGKSINGIEVRINFDKDKLTIINPSTGASIIGVWVEPPAYDNTRGTASYVGVVPDGITTSSGLIGTITFKAKALGRASISVAANSRILLNDGLGSDTIVDSIRADYTILPKAPEGVKVFSETHPIQDNWYNNNNPALSWDRDAGVTGFSFVLDDKPNTVPDNAILINETTKSYEKLNDGLWYFHVKAYKNGVWGTTGTFLMRIDTSPPADFKPEVNYLLAATTFVERALVSFFTTDNLSGVDHYEVGIIDKSQPITQSPVFVETESPYQVSASNKTGLQVVVRAVDKAGNVRDSSIEVRAPLAVTKFLQDNLVYILLAIIIIILLALIFHYLFGHHILRHMRRAFQIIEEEEKTGAPQKPFKVEPLPLKPPLPLPSPPPLAPPVPPPVYKMPDKVMVKPLDKLIEQTEEKMGGGPPPKFADREEKSTIPISEPMNNPELNDIAKPPRKWPLV